MKFGYGYNSDHYDKILLQGILTGKLMTESKVFECSNAIIKAQDNDTPIFTILGKYGINDYYQSNIIMYDLLGDRFILFIKTTRRLFGNEHS